MKDHVIICGLGFIGFRTFEILKSTHQSIVAISESTQDDWRWQVEASGGIFLQGDARDDSLLIKAGIKHAKAILALTDQDMVNVSIAMDARKLNPTIKIIMRMFDNELGSHISRELGIHQIFSTAELAAPLFASSVYDNLSIAQFKMKGKHFFVSEDKKDKTRITASSFVLSECPAAQIDKNEQTRLVAHPADIFKRKKKKFLKFVNKFSYLLSPVFANFRRFLMVFLGVIVVAAFILHWSMALSYIDALYFTITTVTTVGYGDLNFSHTGLILKLFGCLLMLSGTAALAVLFSSITEIILSKKLPSILGGRPVPKRNHVIIVGAGAVGQRVVTSLLDDQLPLVIVRGSAKDNYAEDINRKVALVDGFIKSKDTLKRANVESAQAIVVITDDDVENLSVSMAARKLNPDLVNIIHVFSPKLGEKLQSSLSLDTVLCLPKIVAPYFAAAVFGDEILLAVEWKNQLIYLSKQMNDNEIPTENMVKLSGILETNTKLYSIPLENFE